VKTHSRSVVTNLCFVKRSHWRPLKWPWNETWHVQFAQYASSHAYDKFRVQLYRLFTKVSGYPHARSALQRRKYPWYNFEKWLGGPQNGDVRVASRG
jgi:hypothetical protein